MTNDQKHALGVFLLIVGIIWFFFCVIWMPPLTMALIWLEISLGFEPDVLPRVFLYCEFALVLCAVGAGLYLNVRRLMTKKIKPS
jgi:hypothetical protein